MGWIREEHPALSRLIPLIRGKISSLRGGEPNASDWPRQWHQEVRLAIRLLLDGAKQSAKFPRLACR
jgi:hypothetical protein